jgi:hypothetical protein
VHLKQPDDQREQPEASLAIKTLVDCTAVLDG